MLLTSLCLLCLVFYLFPQQMLSVKEEDYKIKRDGPRELYPNFQRFLTGKFWTVQFSPRSEEISVQWFAFWNFNNFQVFWKVSKKIPLPFTPVSKVSDFLIKCKAPTSGLPTHETLQWWRSAFKPAILSPAHQPLWPLGRCTIFIKTQWFMFMSNHLFHQLNRPYQRRRRRSR